ncbi:hypothetical protein YC2023_095148 [Brassica napus]
MHEPDFSSGHDDLQVNSLSFFWLFSCIWTLSLEVDERMWDQTHRTSTRHKI